MDPRKILGVSDDASPQEIQRAYREKARKHHPDMGGDAWAFQQVQEAYQTLTNPKPNRSRDIRKPKPQSNRKPTTPTGEKRSRSAGPQRGESKTDQRNQRSNSRTTDSKKSKRPQTKAASKPKKPDWKRLLGELQFQSETSMFILVNVLDIFLTHQLLSRGGLEVNPIANFFFKNWDIRGMIAFKLAIVLAVCLIAQIVALYKPKTARLLLNTGSILVGAVVLYSANLLIKHLF